MAKRFTVIEVAKTEKGVELWECDSDVSPKDFVKLRTPKGLEVLGVGSRRVNVFKGINCHLKKILPGKKRKSDILISPGWKRRK